MTLLREVQRHTCFYHRQSSNDTVGKHGASLRASAAHATHGHRSSTTSNLGAAHTTSKTASHLRRVPKAAVWDAVKANSVKRVKAALAKGGSSSGGRELRQGFGEDNMRP